MESYRPLSDTIYSFFISVFVWMGLGLTLTAATAGFIFYYQPLLLGTLFHSPVLMLVLCLFQVALVFFLSYALSSLSFLTALVSYMLYAILNGIIFSTLLVQYTGESIAITFLIGACMFMIMALFGATTRLTISSLGVFFYMVLWGVIIAFLINWYVQSSTANLVISGIGVLLFSALTAYDMQRLTQFANAVHVDRATLQKTALLGALMMYLDLINLFLMLLSFTGKRRD